MIQILAKKIFGSANDRLIKQMHGTVDTINALEPEFEKLDDAALKAKTDEFKARLDKGETLDDLLPEAFATVREAAKRTLGQRHYDVQLMGGMALHQGNIAEMKTGEGKTLVATLPSYLHALTGKGVHVVTVNDYLAKRDAEWMGEVHRFLGLSVGCITNDKFPDERKSEYEADITYGTNNEFGFDYLRDNMKFSREEMVQRDHAFAIVDEVDSILIDEARTPLIISGLASDSSALYNAIDPYMNKLEEAHYELDEKARSVSFTEEGTAFMEELLKKEGTIDESGSLYDIENIQLVHHLDQALKAHTLFEKEKQYIVKDNKVVIIDEFTGRMMDGRRYSEGLHQAIEAKEHVTIQQENQTLASITFQNYFRLYDTLSGMTGTAMTEADEFAEIYGLEVVEIPTHKPLARIDADDDIFRTGDEKYEAILEEIKERHKNKQPLLVGTVTIEQSEFLAKILKKEKIKHNVLNARQHDKEASIIAEAGAPGAVTIATNMAGRGTDIQLGGNLDMRLEEAADKDAEKIKAQYEKDKQTVLDAGGLGVIGTERHESRRIDNQLRGRSGRQGDPGFTKFYLSLEDDLLRIFGADKKMDFVMRSMGVPGEPISHPLLSRTLEKAQQKVEARNFDIRKTLLKFDNVMNDQRQVMFEQRLELMDSEDVADIIDDMRLEVIETLIATHIPEGSYAEQWDVEGLEHELFRIFGLNFEMAEFVKQEGVANQELIEKLDADTKKFLKEKANRYGAETFKSMQKQLLLYTLDELWKNHLQSLDHLRQGINLRAYGQKDPLNEYKREAFQLFEAMLDYLREQVINRLFHAELADETELQAMMDGAKAAMMKTEKKDAGPNAESAQGTVVKNTAAEQIDPNDPETWGKVGRNEPCPCGSGKKYKHCHGQL